MWRAPHVLTVALALVLPTLLGACGSSVDPEPKPAVGSCSETEVIVAASDYYSSTLCGVPGRTFNGPNLGDDPILAASHGRTFFVARELDLIFEVDPSCGTPIAQSSVYSLGPELAPGVKTFANPHDVAAAPDGTLFVTLFNVGKLAFVKDGALEGALDLAAYDRDGNPNAESVRIVDVAGKPKAFVTLELLDDTITGLPPTGNSQMLRIDAETRTVEATIPLVGDNPFNAMAEHDGYLYLAEPRNFNSATDDRAGIERFDTRTSTSQLLVREIDIGGSVAEVAVTNGCGAAIVAGPEPLTNPTSLVTFDPETGAILTSVATSLLRSDDYDIQGLAWRGDTLYVGDQRATSSGYPVHRFDRAPGTCALTERSSPLVVPQPPVSVRPAKSLL